MSYAPYSSPIDPAFYSTLALLLMVSGLATSAFFIVKQVRFKRSLKFALKLEKYSDFELTRFFFQITTSKASRTLSNDFTMAAVSAILMGLGMMFTMLTVGIYVWALEEI